jgi:hypothetical protein
MHRLRFLMPTAVLAGLVTLLPAAPAAAQQPPERVTPPAGEPAPVPEAARERPRRAMGPSTPASQRDSAREAEIVAAARQVLALVDAGNVGEVWDGASGAIRRIVPREEFVRQVTRDRARLGKPLARGEAVLRREHFSGGGPVPQGDYLNIAFATRFSGMPQPLRELVSFRFDEDQVWRVSGYSLRGERVHDDSMPGDSLPGGSLRDDRPRGGKRRGESRRSENQRGEAEPAPDASGKPGDGELSVPPARRP